MRVRRAALAGHFYPDDPSELAACVDRYLDRPAAGGPSPKALVVPHAGYIYSGAVAGAGYAELAPAAATISRVVLAGPAHTVGFDGLAASAADSWETPLGSVAVDTDLRALIESRPGVIVSDRPHQAEHCLEVQIPFLQRLLAPGFTILPLVVGSADAATVSGVLETVWGGPETTIVISSDLSHYHDYRSAGARDAVTAAEIASGNVTAIGPEQACGSLAIAGLLEHEMDGRTIEVANSGDTAGDKSRVVGYGAFAFTER